MSQFFPFEGDNHQSFEYLGKPVEEYFQDFIRTSPIHIDKLENVLKQFFGQGFDDGFFQGLQQGIAEGEDDKVGEIVGDMLQMKQFTVDQIVEATGMEKQEVLDRQKRMQDNEQKNKNLSQNQAGKKNKKKK